MKFSLLILLLYIILFIVAVSPAQSATIRVPADQPTIQAGINIAIVGDTVLVADGIYTGPGNRDINFGGKGVVLKSVNGPDFTIIDCQGDSLDPHRGFNFRSGEDSTAVVDGFTIRGGWSSEGGGIYCYSSNPTISHNSISDNTAGIGGGGIFCNNSSNPTISNNTISGNSALHFFGGGGILCRNSSNPTISHNIISRNSAGSGGGIRCRENSDPTIIHNIISGNSASGGGGGISCNSSNPTISNNTISGNSALNFFGGGGIFCFFSSPTISYNTISGNSAFRGSGLSLLNNSSPSLVNSIIVFNIDGEAIYCSQSSTILTCCDVYGNSGGDWVGCIADQANINGNFSTDPFFCDTAAGDFHLSNFSQCLAQYSPCGTLVGALDLGCDLGFLCADANGDSLVNIDDVDFLIDFYFYGGATPFPYFASDLNCDGSVNIADITYLAAYINGTGAPPCCEQ